VIDRELHDPDAQGCPPEELARRARAGLEHVWGRIFEEPVPFYRRRFEAAGFGAGDALPPLSDLPLTTKVDHRADEAADPPFGSHRSVRREDAVRLGVSTGTTGTPTFIFFGKRDLEVMVKASTRTQWRIGLRAGMSITHTWPQGMYPTSAHGGKPYVDLGILELPVGPPFAAPVAIEHLRLWQILRPDAYRMTPAHLATYEEAGSDAGVDVGDLLDGRILHYLEASCQYDAPRTRLEQAYGARVYNLGGASEVPALHVSDCRFHTGLHAPGDHVVLEVVDPATGKPVPDGERGHLVVSTFDVDSIHLRYDLEDIVVAGTGTCQCGETGPRYILIGREADAVRVDGRTLLPLDVQLALDSAGFGRPEFQIDGTGAQPALRLRIESDQPATTAAGAIGEALRVPVEVEPVAPGTLPRAAFKPRRVV
jgi:phenylacetate-CoA ligase